jgi:hypothetical protein
LKGFGAYDGGTASVIWRASTENVANLTGPDKEPHIYPFSHLIGVGYRFGPVQAIAEITDDAIICWASETADSTKEIIFSLSVPPVGTHIVSLEDNPTITYKYIDPISESFALSTTNYTSLLYYSPKGTANATVIISEEAP